MDDNYSLSISDNDINMHKKWTVKDSANSS